MSDSSDPSQLSRAKREKRDGAVRSNHLDGGAIAVGLVVALATFSPAMIEVVPGWAALIVLAVGVFLGGFLTGRVLGSPQMCGMCHGALMGVALVMIIGFISIVAVTSALYRMPSVADILLVHWLAVANGIVLAVGIGALGGITGAADARTRNQ